MSSQSTPPDPSSPRAPSGRGDRPSDSTAPHAAAREAAAAAIRERDALAEQLRQAFVQSPASTIIYDATGRALAVNPAFERLWGVGLADLPADYCVLEDPQLEAVGVLPLLRRAFGLDGACSPEGAGEPVTLPPLHYDAGRTAGHGRETWTQAHVYPVRDASGAIERVVLTHEDVTARHAAEAALHEAAEALEARNAQLQEQALELELANQTLQDNTVELEMQAQELQAAAAQLEERTAEAEAARARIETILHEMADAYFLLDRDSRVVAANRSMEQASGVPRADMLGRSLWTLFPGTVGTVFERHYRRVAAERTEAHFTHAYADDRFDLVAEVDAYPAPDGGVAVFWRDVTSRVRAEAALRAREEKYRALFTSIDEGFCVVEVLFASDGTAADYRFLETNPAFVRQTGLENAEGRLARELVPGLEQQWIDTYGHVARTGTASRFQLGSDAMGRWFDTYAFRIGRPEDRQVAILFADVSAAKAAEAEREQLLRALEVERARLEFVFQQAPSFLAVLRGPRLVFTLVNDAYYQLVGYRDVVGKPVWEALPEVRGQGFEPLLAGVFATGEPFLGRELPFRVQRTPGAEPETRYVDLSFLPLVEGDGTRSGVIAHGTDVTEQVLARREVERARDASEAERARTVRLQGLTTALAAARTLDEVSTVAVDHMVVALGARTGSMMAHERGTDDLVLLRQVGFPPAAVAELARQPVSMRGPVPECFRTASPLWIESRDGPDGLDARYPSYTEAWDLLGIGSGTCVPLVVAGESVGVISFGFGAPRSFDPADRAFLLALGQQVAVAVERARLFDAERAARASAEAAQDRAERAGREADEANQAKSAFLATMSHELRTPLNAIIGYSQLLELGLGGPLTDQQHDYLERLAGSGQHLLGLVNDVLDLAKIEAGETHVAHHDAMTGAAVRAALDLVAPAAAARAITLVDDHAEDEGVPYVGDETRVRQILVNLLGNAVKFTPDGGTVRVDCETVDEAPAAAAQLDGPGPWAVVHVVDTGVGISREEQERIFDPFYQVERGHTRQQGGTGLGLAISRSLAHLMGGDLTVESRPGRGSTFSLWLPAIRHGAGAPPETAASRAARAARELGALDVRGLSEVGEALGGAIDDVLAAHIGRLSADPALPQARALRRPELEDHLVTLVSDLAQSLVIVGEAGPLAGELLRDGSAIQRTIAEHHGARRHTQGWPEEAVRREHRILREEIERVVRARLRARGGGAAALEEAVRIMLGLVDRAEAISVRGWRRAALDPGSERGAGG